MKLFFRVLCGVLLLCVCITPCFAQGRVGKFGVGIKDIITEEEAFALVGRYWASDRLTLDGNFGFHYIDRDKEEDTKRFLIGVGINQYLFAPEKFSPFVGFDFLMRVDDKEKGETDTTAELDAKFGGEYFIVKNFSITGETLLRLRFGEEYEFGTGGRIGVIFYWN
ncbi:MAG: hypothetical protein AB1847_03765 [bacterium]